MTSAGTLDVQEGEYEAFVSYSRPDREAVRRLEAALREQGRRVWVDWEGIPPTAEWMAEIREAIDGADAVLFVLSPTSVVSQVCAQEVEHAVARNKRIIPVLVVDVDAAQVPAELAKRNWVMLREGDDFARGVAQIVTVLDTDLVLVKRHTRLSVRAAEWEAGDRSPAKLLRGADLAEAEAWLAAPGNGPEPTAEQVSLVTVSRQAASRGQRRLITAVSLTLVFALALGAFSLVQRNNAVDQRNLAQTQALASASLARLGTDPEASVLFALEAAKHGRTPLVEQALRTSLLASHVERVMVPGVTGRNVLSGGSASRLGDLAYSADGTQLFTTSLSESLFVSFDVATGKRLLTKKLEPGFPPYGLTVVRGDVVALASMGGVKVFNARTGAEVPMNEEGGYGGPTYNVAAAPDGRSIFVPQGDGVARQWDVTHHAGLLHTYGVPHPFVPGPQQQGVEAYDAQPNPDGTRLALTGDFGDVQVYDAASAKLVLRFVTGSSTTAARWSPNGRLIATMSQDRIARVWDAATGALVQEYGNDSPLQDVVWATDDYLVTVDSLGHGKVLSVASGEVLSELRGHTEWISFAVASPDGTRIATASNDGTVRIWRLGVAAPTATHLAAETINGADLTPDARTVVSASYGTGTLVSDAATGRTLRTLDAQATEAPTLSPDGRRAVVLLRTGEVRLREVADGRLRWSQRRLGTITGVLFEDPPGTKPYNRVAAPRSAAFSPDGRQVAVLTELGCVVLDAADGHVVARYAGFPSPDGGATSLRQFGHYADLVWDPRGRFIGLPDGDDVVLIDPATMRDTRRLVGEVGSSARGLGLSPDGRTLVVSYFNGTARVWSLATGRLLRTIDLQAIGHGVAINAAGDVVTLANDGYLRVWSPDGSPLMQVRVSSVQAMTVQWAPDGRRLLVGTGEGHDERTGFGSAGGLHVSGRVAFVDCEVCRSYRELIAFARTRVTRRLSAGELTAALGGTAEAIPVVPPSPSSTTSPGPASPGAPAPTPVVTLHPAPVPSPLAGLFTSGSLVLKVYDQGRFWVFDGGGAWLGQLTVDGGTVRLSGGYACDDPTAIASYDWKSVGTDRLALTLVKDLCKDRAAVLTSMPWARSQGG